MTLTAYERHLERGHALLSRRMRTGAAGLCSWLEADPVAAAAARSLRAEVVAVMGRQHARFADAFADELRQSFAEFTKPPAARPAGQWLDLGAFEIMDNSRIQDEIEIAQVVQILDEDCAVELRRLIKFEAALRRHEGVRVAASPFGPPSLARALWAASEGLGASAPVRAELVRCAARWLAPRLGETYAAVRQAGFSDAAQLEAAVAERAGEGMADESPVSLPTGFDVTRPGALFELMDRDDHPPVFAASTAAVPFVPIDDTQPMPLGGDDPRIPALIHSHREDLATLQDDATSARLVTALIGHLFEQIVSDPALSDDARAFIGRLQPSVVRLAAQDPLLLQSHRHPAWTLVNRIAMHLGAEQGAPAPEFMQGLADVIAQVAADPSVPAFEAAVERVAQLQRKQAQRRLTSVEGALELLQRNASLEALVVEARARLQRKLDSALPPSKTKRFVLTVWALVVAQEWTALAPAARRNSPAMDTAADVIWSTDAARSRADAPTLVAMIPELVERLTAGMASVGLSDAMKTAWLDQLAAIHLHAMRRPLGEEATSGPVTVDLELDDELPPEPEVDVAPGPAVLAPTPAEAADPVAAIARLQIGDNVRMQLHGDWMDLQLLWTSDNGYFLLFAGKGDASHSFTRPALQKMVAQGLLRTPDASSALQRAGDEIIRKRH